MVQAGLHTRLTYEHRPEVRDRQSSWRPGEACPRCGNRGAEALTGPRWLAPGLGGKPGGQEQGGGSSAASREPGHVRGAGEAESQRHMAVMQGEVTVAPTSVRQASWWPNSE